MVNKGRVSQRSGSHPMPDRVKMLEEREGITSPPQRKRGRPAGSKTKTIVPTAELDSFFQTAKELLPKQDIARLRRLLKRHADVDPKRDLGLLIRLAMFRVMPHVIKEMEPDTKLRDETNRALSTLKEMLKLYDQIAARGAGEGAPSFIVFIREVYQTRFGETPERIWRLLGGPAGNGEVVDAEFRDAVQESSEPATGDQ